MLVVEQQGYQITKEHITKRYKWDGIEDREYLMT